MHLLPLGPDRAAQIEEQDLWSNRRFRDSSCSSWWDTHEGRATYLLHMCRRIYVFSMYSLWLVVQSLKVPQCLFFIKWYILSSASTFPWTRTHQAFFSLYFVWLKQNHLTLHTSHQLHWGSWSEPSIIFWFSGLFQYQWSGSSIFMLVPQSTANRRLL